MSGEHVLGLKRPTWTSMLGAFLLIACNATDPASPSHEDPGASTGGSQPVATEDAGVGASDGGAPSGCNINGEQYAEGQTDVPSRDGCNFCTCHDGELTECTMIDCGNPCVVARKLDECCPTFKPSFRSELESNECLVEYGMPVDRTLAQKCFAKAGAMCALVDCAQQAEPPSRAAGNVANDRCVFSDECGSNDDCVLASDGSACCACVEAMPAELVAKSGCLVKEGESVPRECACTAPVECGMCPAPPAAAQCEIRDSFSRCVAVQ